MKSTKTKSGIFPLIVALGLFSALALWYAGSDFGRWGRRLDPVEFWKGRPIWLDSSALNAAHAVGRGWPPMPYRDPSLDSYDDRDRSSRNYEVEGPNIRYVGSVRESMFWGKFPKAHPRPPEDLSAKQKRITDQIYIGHLLDVGKSPGQISAGNFDGSIHREIQEALRNGFPSEMFDDRALFWCYVMERRTLNEAHYRRVRDLAPEIRETFFETLAVAPKFITEPLTPDQLKAANAWKIAYLQRLRREKTDESYINAYLKAWNLSEAEVIATNKSSEPAR